MVVAYVLPGSGEIPCRLQVAVHIPAVDMSNDGFPDEQHHCIVMEDGSVLLASLL